MTEIREDVTTGDLVLIAPERALRPQHPPPGGGCPFCPGNEDQTPPETWRSEDAAGSWTVRVFPNRYPIVTGPGAEHEVIVESRLHDWDLATGSEAEVEAVLDAYRGRHRALSELRPALVVVFRNHGRDAGTSLGHPHAQAVALPVLPTLTRRRLEVARRWFAETGTGVYERLASDAAENGERVVAASDRLVAFVPFAAGAPFETWISPRIHEASFGHLPDADLVDLARILRAVLVSLRAALGDPPYNLVVDGPPPADAGARYFAWTIRIVPRLATPAGFELATGIAVNAGRPEAQAAVLRAGVDRLLAGLGPSPVGGERPA